MKKHCELDIPFEVLNLSLEEYDAEFDYRSYPGDEQNYFVYQPSGGLNNQRVLLEHALVICQLLNRTCLVPPAAAHTNCSDTALVLDSIVLSPMS